MRLRLLHIIFILAIIRLEAQTPVINAITPIATYPGNKLLISGAGFSNTPAQLKVSFDHVAGTITASTLNTIEVTVPPQARLSNIEVLNLVSGFSGKSTLKFVPTFSGEDFDPTKIATPLSNPSGLEAFDVCSCDLDGDGKPDKVATKRGGTATDILILRNTSTLGNLSYVATTVNVTSPTANITCGDLNGDGKPDLVASRDGSTRNEVFVLVNTSTSGSISFAPFTRLFLDVGHFAWGVAIRDLNLDGKPEVIVSNAFDDPVSPDNLVYVFLNASSAGVTTFAATPLKITVASANTTYGLVVQDLDGDSKPEIIVNQFTAANLFVLKNTSSGSTVSFAASQTLAVIGSSFINVASADFNEDGKLDLVATSFVDSRVVVLMNQSTSSAIAFGSRLDLTATLSNPQGVDVADVDGDGDIDIIVGNTAPAAVNLTVFKHDGNNSPPNFTGVSVLTGKQTRNVRVGDYDGDSKPDFAYTTTASGNSVDIIRSKDCFVPVIQNQSNLTICSPQTIRLDGIPNAGVTTFNWKESGGSVSSGTNPYYDITTGGVYTVEATSEGGACVKTSNTITVSSGLGTVPADPVISSNSPLCSVPGQNLQLNGPTVASVTYVWNGPNGFTSALEDPIINNVTQANAGIYTLKLVTSGGCTSNTASTTVGIVNMQGFSQSSSVPSNIICLGSNLTLSVTSQAGYNYQWIKDNVDIGAQTSTTLVVTQDGAYNVRVTNPAISGCSLTTTATNVSVLTVPVAAFTANPTGCVGQSVTFTDQSTKDSRGTLVYAWNFGDTGTAIIASPTHTYATAQTFAPALGVSYTGVTGCSSSKTGSIIISAIPVVAVTPGVTIKEGESTQLVASGATTYAWSPVTGLSDPAIANPVATPTVTTTYTVIGTSGGCSSTNTTNTILIEVTPIGPVTLNIPNVFTPNGDAFNDEWVIPNLGTECTISLFDATGRKILEQKGSPVIWNGMYKGSPAPEGTYFYVLSCPSSEPVSGNVLLAR